jgi:hypothetical protein
LWILQIQAKLANSHDPIYLSPKAAVGQYSTYRSRGASRSAAVCRVPRELSTGGDLLKHGSAGHLAVDRCGVANLRYLKLPGRIYLLPDDHLGAGLRRPRELGLGSCWADPRTVSATLMGPLRVVKGGHALLWRCGACSVAVNHVWFVVWATAEKKTRRTRFFFFPLHISHHMATSQQQTDACPHSFPRDNYSYVLYQQTQVSSTPRRRISSRHAFTVFSRKRNQYDIVGNEYDTDIPVILKTTVGDRKIHR